MSSIEIQMGDRSTVIVPDSGFIAKVVRDLTHASLWASSSSSCRCRLTRMPSRAAARAACVHRARDALDDPPSDVTLDSIDGGNLIFNAAASVNTPRKAVGVKSSLLFALLVRLRNMGWLTALEPTTTGITKPTDVDLCL